MCFEMHELAGGVFSPYNPTVHCNYNSNKFSMCVFEVTYYFV